MSPIYCTIDPPTRHVFLRDIQVMAHIGAFAEERRTAQRVLISIDMGVEDRGEQERASGVEDLASVVNYAPLVGMVEGIVQEGHIMLVETLAERIASLTLAMDKRVQIVRVRVEKPDIFAQAAGVGVEIERRRFVHPKG